MNIELISETEKIKFYRGIDFNIINNHPKDGSSGFICFFVDDYVDSVIKYIRESKINFILYDDSPILTLSTTYDINNSYILIYNTPVGTFDILYKSVQLQFNLKWC